MKMGCRLLAVLAAAVFIAVPLCAGDSDADVMDGLMLFEVDSYGKGVAVHNYGSSSVDMRDYAIADMPSLTGSEGSITFSSSLKVPAGSTFVFVKTYDSSSAFCTQDGVVCYSWENNTVGISASSQFILSNTKDDVYLFKGDSIIDAMCYGSAEINDSSLWSGSSVGVCKNGWMMRIGNDDTNTSSDWRGYIPGQTTYAFDPTLQYDATVTPFTFPESGGVPVYQTISSATESIQIEIYMLTSKNMMGLLAQKASEGVDVDILLEGNPLDSSNSIADASPYYRYIVDSGAEIRFIGVSGSDGTDRFDYVHAKYAVIDSDTVLLTSENWVTDNLNGEIRTTDYSDSDHGNRGWGAVIESRDYASFMSDVFANDWSMDYGDVKTFESIYTNSGISTPTYTVPQGMSTVYRSYQATVTPVLSNDSSFAAMEYYAANAEERLWCENQSLSPTYQTLESGPLSMLNAAAQRGVDVRLLFGSNVDSSYVGTINATSLIKTAVMSAPYLHNKGVIADDVSWVSSVNWTPTSFNNNRESCAAIHSSEIAEYFASYFAKDYAQYYSYSGIRAYFSELESEYGSGSSITASVTVIPEGDYTYVWDLGDGSELRTTTVGRIVATPADGTHTMAVTISDSNGNSVTVTQEYTMGGSDSLLDSLGDYAYYIGIAILILIAIISSALRSGRKGSKGSGKRRSTGSSSKKKSSRGSGKRRR